MPYVPLPEIFTTGDIIPSGWANNIAGNFNWINARTGGDPGSAGFFLASSSGVAGLWRYLQTADYRANTIPDTALINQKVNSFATPSTTFGGLLSLGRHGMYEVNPASDGPVPSNTYYVLHQVLSSVSPNTYAMQLAVNANNVNEVYIRVVISGAASPWRRLWHAGNGGSGSGLDADTLRTYAPGNGSGNIPVSNGTVNTNLNADLLRGLAPGNAAGNVAVANGTAVAGLVATSSNQLQGLTPGNANGQVAVNNGVVCTNLVAANSNALGSRVPGNATQNIPISNGAVNVDLVASTAMLLNGRSWGNGTNQIPISNGVACTDLVAAVAVSASTAGNVGGFFPTTVPVGNAIPVTDASGKLDAFVTPSAVAGVPAGVIAMWMAAGAPTGWTVYTGFAGRFLVGSGGAAGAIGAVGGTLNHRHAMDHGHTGGTDNYTGSGNQNNVATPNPENAPRVHAHSFTIGISSGVNTGQTSGMADMPPWVSVGFIQKS